MKVAFEDFTFDVAAQELRRAGKIVHLRPKAMYLLELLIERRGKVVTRGELIERIWPEVVVSDASLKNLISTLRDALDDHEREGRFIQNVHQRGYRFTADTATLDERSEAPRVLLRCEGRRIPLHDGVFVAGRAPDCAIVLDDPSVSRHHAKLTITADRIAIEDLGSRNGLFIDGVRAAGVQPLAGEHELRFGETVAYLSPGPTTLTTQVLRR